MVVGEQLRLRSIGLTRFDRYELAARDGRRVGLMSLGGGTELARIESAAGVWNVRKRLARGWELLVESADGRQLGYYSGRHWLPGGTISLIDCTRVDLRRSRLGGWQLQMTGTGQAFARLRLARSPADGSFTIHSLPAGLIEPDLVVLTACAIVMLERALQVPRGAG